MLTKNSGGQSAATGDEVIAGVVGQNGSASFEQGGDRSANNVLHPMLFDYVSPVTFVQN